MLTFTNTLSVIVYLNNSKIDTNGSFNTKTIFDDSFHECYLGNNIKQGSNERFNGHLYNFSLLFGIDYNTHHDISESDAFKIHQYYNYIHNI